MSITVETQYGQFSIHKEDDSEEHPNADIRLYVQPPMGSSQRGSYALLTKEEAVLLACSLNTFVKSLNNQSST